MFGLFKSKREKYLEKSDDPLAALALDLYCGDNQYNFAYYCGGTDTDWSDWQGFKNWLLNWVLAGECSEAEVLDCYLYWANPLTENARESTIKGFDSGFTMFDKADPNSARFFIFAAYCSQKLRG